MKRNLGVIDTGLILGLLALSLVGVMAYLFPTATLPSPEGQYAVGLQILELEDRSRQDPFVDVEMTRRLLIDVCYPAEVTAGKRRSAWFRTPSLFINSLASNYDLPSIIFQHLRAVKTNSYIEALPLESEEGFPVLILSPGTPAIVPLYFSFAEYLASRGYIVIGIEHPYGAAVVEFSDGTQAHFSRERAFKFPGVETFEEGVRYGMRWMAEDFSFVIDELERLNASSEFPNGFFDTSRISVFGHSGGGGVVSFLSQRDERVKAMVSFDPALFAMTEESLSAGVNIPSFIMETGLWLEREEAGDLHLFIQNSPVKPFHLKIPDANHPDFAMLDRLSPLAHYLGFTGTFMANGGEEYLHRSIFSFLEYVLNNGSIDILIENLLSRKDVQVFYGAQEIVK